MEPVVILSDPFNRTDTRALINIVPTAFAGAMIQAHKEHPEWFGCTEHDLLKKLGKAGCKPNPSDNRIRMKFWMEYDIAQSEGRRINLASAIAGCCSEIYFHERYSREASKLAWMLTPPANYLVVTEEALQVGLEMLRTYLSVSAIKDEGLPCEKLDAKVAEIQLKIVALLDLRVKGAVVQKTMNLHASVPKGQITQISETKSMEELEKRLHAIAERRRKAQGQIVDKPVVGPEQTET